MKTYFEIPIEGGFKNSNQTFTVKIKKINYRFDIHFDYTVEQWILNLYKEDQPYALNLSLLTGSLINALVSRQMGVSLFMTGNQDPTLGSLGTDNLLMMAVTEKENDI